MELEWYFSLECAVHYYTLIRVGMGFMGKEGELLDTLGFLLWPSEKKDEHGGFKVTINSTSDSREGECIGI